MTYLNKTIRRKTRTSDRLPHGCREDLVVFLYPGGFIGIREAGRRREVKAGLGWLYAELLRREVEAKKREKKLARRRA
jgi:hypothetical protein